jgi:hypothetical protein
MGNASLLDVYGNDNTDLLRGLKQDGNVETQEEVVKRWVEKSTPRIISRNEFSIPNRWVIYSPSLPGYVYHKSFGVVTVVAKRVVYVPQSRTPEYAVYAVCPVEALIDPPRDYVDTRSPPYLNPVVLYEVSEVVIIGSYKYELFQFKERIIYRFVYNENNPGESIVELACSDDGKRGNTSIETTWESLRASSDERDIHAIELFVRTYASWATKMDIMRVYNKMSLPNPQSNYIQNQPRIYPNDADDKGGINYNQRIDAENQENFNKSIQKISKKGRALKYRSPKLASVLKRL